MGLSMVAVFLFAGTMSTSGIVDVPAAPPVERHPAVRLVRHLRDRDGRRDQPGAVRPARGGVRTGRRLPHRVLVVQVRDVLPRRVHQHGHRLGAGHHAVPRRLARTRGRSRCGTAPTPAGGRCSGSPSRSSLCIFVFVWLRGTLPRLRYDQFMHFGWKVLIPINLVWILAVTTIRVLRDRGWPSWKATAIPLARRAARSSSCPAPDDLRRARRAAEARRPARDEDEDRRRPASRPTFPIPPMDLVVPTPPRRDQLAARPARPRRSRRRREATTMADDRAGGPRRRRRATAGPAAALGFAQGLRADLLDDVQEGLHPAVPVRLLPDRAALPRPARAEPAPGRAGEVRRLRAVRLGLPGRRDLRRGRRQHRRRSGTRRASGTARSTRSTTCAASSAGCASRPARPGR